ncbi:hypothetical protein TraAM80_07057 [Trypanosoma rangeli]|uniref:Uncharacterized protein n=1 Tax=Trypanosoma rangeli TaxID=5698 RepID=A0A3R7KU45_TRYRA|nr:uncharacterized protein TraAM80_07057 [Trypanosoma rangeli]RNF01406.1 hypothetical protein TraAM80_07057 [Trypanosoma rangeli]|eukprot:RNF01406.1 hypothetical protein TraAM80_07057 [Trypanosoma rangeli]
MGPSSTPSPRVVTAALRAVGGWWRRASQCMVAGPGCNTLRSRSCFVTWGPARVDNDALCFGSSLSRNTVMVCFRRRARGVGSISRGGGDLHRWVWLEVGLAFFFWVCVGDSGYV